MKIINQKITVCEKQTIFLSTCNFQSDESLPRVECGLTRFLNLFLQLSSPLTTKYEKYVPLIENQFARRNFENTLPNFCVFDCCRVNFGIGLPDHDIYVTLRTIITITYEQPTLINKVEMIVWLYKLK